MVTRKTFYSQSFNVSLAGVTVITAAIILVMQSSVVLSLGMVGALSIVRFRTAIKDPLDLMFVFWSISTGIICGAGLAQVAVILAVIITAGVLLLNRIPMTKAPLILVVNCDSADSEKEICSALEKHSAHYNIKSRNMTRTTLDLVVEVRVKDGGRLIKDIANTENVTYATLLTHTGDATF